MSTLTLALKLFVLASLAAAGVAFGYHTGRSLAQALHNGAWRLRGKLPLLKGALAKAPGKLPLLARRIARTPGRIFDRAVMRFDRVFAGQPSLFP